MLAGTLRARRAIVRGALRRLVGIAATAACALGIGGADPARAQTPLAPSNVYMNSYNFVRINDANVGPTRANAFTVISDGVIDYDFLRNRLDTFNEDNLGISKDFVGLDYSSPHRFDSIVVDLAGQANDGGDWEAPPKIYILKNRFLTGDMVEPNLSPNWIEVTGAVETTGHAFAPQALGGAGTRIRYDLSAIPVAQRTGWGWAVGGVDGTANGSLWNFISLTDAHATGVPASAPAVTRPATPVPTNVIANQYNSVARSGDPMYAQRGTAFASLTNGLLDRNGMLGQDGFDTFEGDGAGVLTDFVGLQYGSLYRFDTLKVELGQQFGDGGDWETTPKIYILKNPVDTGSTRPETDPTNWMEITGAVETTGHAFNPIATTGPGGTVNFNLSGIPAAQRTGWGWAIGGVDGNQAAGGVVNFISVTEASATGALIPGPYELKLEVNTTNGETRIVNSAPMNISLDFYEITSPGNDLNVAGWNKLETAAGNPAGFPAGNGTGNGWEELGTGDAQSVAEAYLQSSSLLTQGNAASLGNLFAVGGDQTLTFRYRAPDGVFYDGAVDYVTGGNLSADFNDNGSVGGADLALWKTAFGTTAVGDADGDNDTDGNDILLWQRQLNSAAGASPASGAVPEPAGGLLALAAVAGLRGVSRRGRCCTRPARQKKLNSQHRLNVRSIALAALVATTAIAAARANVTDDRWYRLGDDPSEHASEGITVGAGPGNIAPGRSLDSQGPSGAYLDVTANGTPTYISVSDRPGAGATLGASFDGPGSGDRLTGFNVNIPSQMWDNPAFSQPLSLNYERIQGRGMQFWAKPNGATQNVRQDLIADSPQHTVFISATNRWGLEFGETSNPNRVIVSDAPVAFGQWTHVMELGGFPDPEDARTTAGGALYVNGVAVAASSSYYAGDTTSPLAIGGNGAGANLYRGVIDDVRIFLWGDNRQLPAYGGAGAAGRDYGRLNLAVDNHWIAAQLVALGVTDAADVNLDGAVTPADVTAFVPDWRKVRLVNGVQVGDWLSRQDGDLNYDGIVDLKDANILHQGLIAAGVPSGLDFALLVPEPGSLGLAVAGLTPAALRRRRMNKRR